MATIPRDDIYDIADCALDINVAVYKLLSRYSVDILSLALIAEGSRLTYLNCRPIETREEMQARLEMGMTLGLREAMLTHPYPEDE